MKKAVWAASIIITALAVVGLAKLLGFFWSDQYRPEYHASKKPAPVIDIRKGETNQLYERSNEQDPKETELKEGTGIYVRYDKSPQNIGIKLAAIKLPVGLGGYIGPIYIESGEGPGVRRLMGLKKESRYNIAASGGGSFSAGGSGAGGGASSGGKGALKGASGGSGPATGLAGMMDAAEAAILPAGDLLAGEQMPAGTGGSLSLAPGASADNWQYQYISQNAPLLNDGALSGLSGDQIAQLTDLFLAGEAGLDPDPITIGGITWSYTPDIAQDHLDTPDAWYDGTYHIQLGSGIIGEGGAEPLGTEHDGNPEPATGLIALLGFLPKLMAWMRKIARP